MTWRMIDTVVNIDEDRRLVLQLPTDAPTGRHRVVAVLDEATEAPNVPGVPSSENGEWAFPVIPDAQWPADMPLTREEMYDDSGR